MARALRAAVVWTGLAIMATVGSGAAEEPTTVISVRADQPGASPTQIGIFFEDINYGADGGLYPERVKNRSFEFDEPLMGWTVEPKGRVTVRDQGGLNASNLHHARVDCGAGQAVALTNEGFFGIGVTQGAEFTGSVFARSAGGPGAVVALRIVGPDGRDLGHGQVEGIDGTWKRHECRIQATGTEPKARLVVRVTGPGAVDLDMVSLFPRDTWKGRPNGLRPDLVKWLAELKPAFLRFPGGCIVEGRNLGLRYQWKTTIGPLEERRLIRNRWNDEFEHRPAPDYYQSFGLGFFEYFQLCEDLGASPLPIVNCGMACQFNTGELVPLDQLDPYVQDALDLIEFATGPATGTWGARRAAMGHPEPFPLTMLGIGNEQWGPAYIERYERFAKAIHERAPQIRLVSSAGPRPADDLYRYAWSKLPALGAPIIDEHCYDRPAWFLDNTHRYDGFDSNGPRIFMGEYAAQSVKVASPENRNTWECALAEAAYLTGLERNSAVVELAAYAPLLAHEEGWQWRPDLIWFDNLGSYATPNYYVQQLFAVHRGDVVVPVQISGQPLATSKQPGLYVSASRSNAPGAIILKVVNSAPAPRDALIRLEGVKAASGEGLAVVLTAPELSAENDRAEPLRVAPRRSAVEVAGPEVRHRFAGSSLTVLRIPLEASR